MVSGKFSTEDLLSARSKERCRRLRDKRQSFLPITWGYGKYRVSPLLHTTTEKAEPALSTENIQNYLPKRIPQGQTVIPAKARLGVWVGTTGLPRPMWDPFSSGWVKWHRAASSLALLAAGLLPRCQELGNLKVMNRRLFLKPTQFRTLHVVP